MNTETMKPMKREVLTRFTPEELAQMRDDTGADCDATAVAGFVRKRLAKPEA